VRRRVGTNLVVLTGYCTVSFLYFGLPLLAHPGRKLIGYAPNYQQTDPEIFVWSLGWWPHAILHWTNPFFSHSIYAPSGVNLIWTTSVPGLALAFSPITLLFGPSVAFNVAQLLLPAVAAWTAYLLCRYLTASIWAALVGGYVFGFSSYLLGHEFAGHLNLTGIFLLPLFALVLVKYVRRELSAIGLAWRLGVLVACQLSISTEVTLTLTLVLVLAIVLALVLLREQRQRVVSALPVIAAGYALAALLAAPLVVYALKGYVPSGFADPDFFSGDLLNFVVPTRLTDLGGSSLVHVATNFPGNDDERGSYLGLPVLAIVAILAVRNRRSAPVRFLLAALVVAAVLTSGTKLIVDGRRLIAFPWRLVAHRPVVDNVLPERFAVYASLAAAVMVALWIASTRGRILARPIVLPALAVAALVPAVTQVKWAQEPQRSAFFTTGAYRQCIPRGETVAIFPFGRWGDSMLWQAESGYRFRMPEGDMGRHNYPPRFVFAPITSVLQFQNADRPNMAGLLSFARAHRVDRFVALEGYAYPDGTMMHSFGPVQLTDGVLVSPACGYTSLADDTRLDTPGNPNFGGTAFLTIVTNAERQLRTAAGRAPMRAALANVHASLQQVARFDPTNGDLANAVASVAQAEARPAAAASQLRRAAAALAAYAAHISRGTR
jgi:hypothetical protein